MYASMGAITLFVSRDVEGYRHLIRFLGWIAIIGGAGVTTLDATLRLPLFWTLTEGPFTVALGLVLIALVTRMPVEAAAAGCGLRGKPERPLSRAGS